MIGINEQIASSSGTNSGVGFAIPVTSVRYSLDQLRDDGEVDYAYLGVTSESLYPQLADHLELDTDSGALITDVVDGGPADEAGLRGSDGETTFQLPAGEDRRRLVIVASTASRCSRTTTSPS